jgi:hypothetical protein
MTLYETLQNVESREGFAKFIAALRLDLSERTIEWENPTLDRFLSAIEAWVGSMENYYRNTGQEFDGKPSWRTFADILYAGKIYE